MITGVDTSILADFLRSDIQYGPPSTALLRKCLLEGRLVVCEVVWAELSGLFPAGTDFEKNMAQLHVAFSAMDVDVASRAGELWHAYRRRGGTRHRMLTDFLIGAHAQLQCDRLLTRDQGFYRDYFEGLEVIDP